MFGWFFTSAVGWYAISSVPSWHAGETLAGEISTLAGGGIFGMGANVAVAAVAGKLILTASRRLPMKFAGLATTATVRTVMAPFKFVGEMASRRLKPQGARPKMSCATVVTHKDGRVGLACPPGTMESVRRTLVGTSFADGKDKFAWVPTPHGFVGIVHDPSRRGFHTDAKGNVAIFDADSLASAVPHEGGDVVVWGSAPKASKRAKLAEAFKTMAKATPVPVVGAGGDPIQPPRPLAECIAQLDAMIGLKTVKEFVRMMQTRLAGDKARGGKGFAQSRHMVFRGPPGVGKTTVARCMAEILHGLGVLSKGHLVEADRKTLVAPNIGETTAMTLSVLESALGGVLFIDEAYMMHVEDSPRDFGRESMVAILKYMDDHRDDLVVIVAGYPDAMDRLIASNDGLRSRFVNTVDFEAYTPSELMRIYSALCKSEGLLSPPETTMAARHAVELALSDGAGNGWGNAREIRELVGKAKDAHDCRLHGTPQFLTEANLLGPDDIVRAAEILGWNTKPHVPDPAVLRGLCARYGYKIDPAAETSAMTMFKAARPDENAVMAFFTRATAAHSERTKTDESADPSFLTESDVKAAASAMGW